MDSLVVNTDITGQKFGSLTVEKIVYGYVDGKLRWLVSCDCGNKKVVRAADVKRGKINSCGCLYKSMTNRLTHGLTHTKIYSVWIGMLRRCNDPNREQYKYYGARGITVCERWKKFENFYEDMGDVPVDMTIDRIDNNGNYEPGNCRWATTEQQNARRRIYNNCGLS